MNLRTKVAYARRVLPTATWHALRPSVSGRVHLIIALADHFEPGIVPEDGQKRAPMPEQEKRLQWWREQYPKMVDAWRDADGRPFVHTYFYPAEQYDTALLEMLADHCHAGWGETEIHLHHGIPAPDTPENTRRTLLEFRDRLAERHGCLAVEKGFSQPRYCFVHGNFALANSAEGLFCGVDSEMKILGETGCYADFTLPTAQGHPSQTAKINSLYECALPLDKREPQRAGTDLRVGRPPRTFPLILQGPLMTDLKRSVASKHIVIENAAITAPNPLSLRRLALWKQAHIHVKGRPDWIFIKLHCHGMDPTQKNVVMGRVFEQFLRELVTGADSRKEILHFVTTREMTNIALAACEGREGNPGEFRDYRFMRMRHASKPSSEVETISGASKT